MRILAINPGGTSTKIAVYEDNLLLMKKSIVHTAQDLEPFKAVFDEYEYRMKLVTDSLENEGIDIKSLSAVVGRGGLLKPIQGGTYRVNDSMIDDVRNAINGEHASNLGCVLAKSIAEGIGVPSFVVDPVSVDEFLPESRLTGIKDIDKASWLHSLNQKAVARETAGKIGKSYEELNFVVAHLGSGISIAAHRKGNMIDGGGGRVDGPFSPERSGGLPAYPLIELCYSGKYTKKEMVSKVSSVGGMYAYLGTKDVADIVDMYNAGDKKAVTVIDAFVLQTVKEIGAYAAALDGNVDRVIITGGIAYSNEIVEMLKKKVSFIAPVEVVPGEKEMEALMLGAKRVLTGQEEAMIYP
ncbi:butyrate kinase [Peptoclostridium litorale DSM 5388]|uniref:Probable butyrate kinase n=1 Tax=Peptoclostridium litorale DSM 5388 TaxID=1121324 RepID=A0A069RK13_PEPLI|nr:butyrate kinase [Peptoclostridium litorale]KDR96480.1 putative butyrate kinase 1 [Peptoclostridium litorale DSM 5388]SIN70102.1 butyrate kinase [Peptoclostridium litorale DSM 5388]